MEDLRERWRKWVEGEMNLAELQGWTEEELWQVSSIGHSLFLQGRYAEALRLFKGLVALAPDRPYYRKALASLYLQVGNMGAAVEQLDAAIALDPDDPSLLAKRCEAHLRAGSREQAMADWGVLSRAYPDHPLTRRLGVLLENLEKIALPSNPPPGSHDN